MRPEPKPAADGVAPEGGLARALRGIAEATGARVLMCVDETVATCLRVRRDAGGFRFLAASASKEACDELARAGADAVCLPMRVMGRFRQAQGAIGVALQRGKLTGEDRVACSVGCRPGTAGLFILVLDVGREGSAFAAEEWVSEANGVRGEVIEAAIEMASEVARAALRGKRLGAIFMLGDSGKVLEGSRQLVPNPFENIDPKERSLLSPSIRETLVELAKLDGAFVARGDGLIRTAGTFLSADAADTRVPLGLGARHLAAAAATSRSRAVGVVASATDGHVRVFSRGELVAEINPRAA